MIRITRDSRHVCLTVVRRWLSLQLDQLQDVDSIFDMATPGLFVQASSVHGFCTSFMHKSALVIVPI